MNIIYITTKILTYPGAYLKGVFEHLVCRMLGIPVCGGGYLQGDEWCGHAEHEPAGTPVKAWLVCFLPGLAQCVLASIFFGASVGPLLIFGLRGGEIAWLVFFLAVVSLFLGVSMISNVFPHWSDARRLWHLFYGTPTEEELQLMEAEIDDAIAAIETMEEEAVEEDEETEEAEEGEVEARYAAEETIAEPPALIEEVPLDATEEEEAEDEAAEEICEILTEEKLEEILEEDVAAAAQPAAPPQAAPKFAGLAAKIIFAPSNACFMAGAALERFGITAILAIGITVLLLVLNYV